MAAQAPSLPAAAEGPVKLHERQQLLQPQLRQDKPALEEVALGVQHLEVTVQAALVAEIREPVRFGQGLNKPILLSPLLALRRRRAAGSSVTYASNAPDSAMNRSALRSSCERCTTSRMEMKGPSARARSISSY